nr:hypothetical protein [Actinacidiphila bryophytorum]
MDPKFPAAGVGEDLLAAPDGLRLRGQHGAGPIGTGLSDHPAVVALHYVAGICLSSHC